MKLHLPLIQVPLFAIVFTLLMGCPNALGNDEEGGNGDEDSALPYQVVAEDSQRAVSAGSLTPGDTLYLRVNRQGFNVWQYPVEYVGVEYYDIVIRIPQDSGLTVGHGDSGSPVLNGDQEVVAILYAGDPTNKELFYARDAVYMINEINSLSLSSASPTPQMLAPSELPGRSDLLLRHVSGIGDNLLRESRGVAGLVYRETETSPRRAATLGTTTDGSTAPAAATVDSPTGPGGIQPSQVGGPLEGTSIAVWYLWGMWYDSYVSGTVSFAYSEPEDAAPTMYAFGHDVVGEGPFSAPVSFVPAIGFFDSLSYPKKMVNVDTRDPYYGWDVIAAKAHREDFWGVTIDFLSDEEWQSIDGPYATDLSCRVTSTLFIETSTETWTEYEDIVHFTASTTRSQEDHYYQAVAVAAPLIEYFKDQYDQRSNVTVDFTAFNDTDGAPLSVTDMLILYSNYQADNPNSSYLSYIVGEIYDELRSIYDDAQQAGIRFGEIAVDITLAP